MIWKGKTPLHYFMVLVIQYAYLAILYGYNTNIQLLCSQYHLIQHTHSLLQFYSVIGYGQTVFHVRMFLEDQYTCVTIIYGSHINILSLESQYWLIRQLCISLQCYLVNCKWKDHIVLLCLSGCWICIIDSTILFPNYHLAFGVPQTAYPSFLDFLPGLSGQLEKHHRFPVFTNH